MKIFSQAKLLLWKNIVLRYRRPGILLLEVLWPVLVIGIIAIMRLAVPPTKHGNCHYQPRALPSAGAIPFLQTYLCNLDNPCYRSDQKVRSALTTAQQFSAMTQNLGPLLASEEILDVLAVSNKTSNVYTMIKKAVGNKELLHGLESIMNVKAYFRNPQEVESILVDDYNLLTKDEADAFLNSKINVGQLTNLTGSPDFKAIACDHEKLASYVKFPRGADVQEISDALCNITSNQTTGLANLMIRQLNFTTILEALKLMEEVKATFLDEHNVLSYTFEVVAQMFEVAAGSDGVMKILGTFAGIPDAAKFIRAIPEFVEGFNDFGSIMAVIDDITSRLSPLMSKLHVDSPIWRAVQNSVKLGENFVILAEGKWNGTSEEFMRPMKSLIANIEDMAHDKEGRIFIAFFKFINKIDLVKAYDEIIYTQGLSESTINSTLVAAQQMFEDMSVWDTVKNVIRISEHSFDVFAVVTEKSIDLRHNLENLFDSNDVMKSEVKKIFAYGPVITKTVLDSFVNKDLFTDIANDASYQDVCRKALLNLQTQVSPDVYNDVKNTLCSDAGDVNTAMENLLSTLKLNELSKLINATVHEFENLYRGEFFRDNVQLVNIYDHYVRFTTAVNNYLYDDFKWFEVFQGVYLDDVDFNVNGWEPVTDMLDENLLTTLLLGSFQSIGKAFTHSPLAAEFAPTIHTMSQMVKLIYETMADVNALVARDTPMMQLANMVTTYSPEIIDGLSYVLENNDDMIFKLLSSNDSMRTFCGDRYLYQMGMPSYVPLDEINGLVCNTDWEVVIGDMAKPAQRIEEFMPKLADILNSNDVTRYDIEADWIQMEDYSERLFDMIAQGQILGVVDMRTTTVEIFGQLDLSRTEEAMAALNRLMERLTTKDIMVEFDLAYKVMTLFVDDSAGTSVPDMFKTVMAVFESTLDQQIESVKNPQALTSLMASLNSLPPNVRSMVVYLGKAYPEFVSAAAGIMFEPTKLTAKIISLGATPPDCSSVFLSDYLLLARDSEVHKFEVFLCGLNMTEFLNELIMSQTSSFMNGTDMFNMDGSSSKNLPDVDWRKLQEKINEYNRLIMTPATPTSVSGGQFDLYPFDMAAINMAWDKFYNAADTLSRLDPIKVQTLLNDITGILATTVDNTNDLELEGLLYGSIYLSSEFTKAIVQELADFNTSSPVTLVDHIGSEELKKLINLLVVSPDINAVGVATLSRLLSNPQKAMISMDFEAMCQNLTMFSDVFVVSASPRNPADIQHAICDALTNINITRLVEELMDRPSIHTILKALDVMGRGDMTVMKQAVTVSQRNSEKLSALIEKIAMNPPVVRLTAQDDVWTQYETYAREWGKLGDQLGKMMDGSMSQSWEAMVSHVAVETLKSLPEASTIFGYIDAFVDVTLSQLDDSSGDFFKRFNEYPNTAKILDLMNHAPGAIETILYTVLRQSQKLNAWTSALQSWGSFCMTPADTLFTVPTGVRFSMADFKAKMCDIDQDQLTIELGKIQKMDKIEAVFSGIDPVRGNATYTEEKLKHLLEMFAQQTMMTSGEDVANSFNLRLFNETVWEGVSGRVVSWLNDTANEYMSPEKISELIASTLKDTVAGMAPDGAQMINKGFAIADVVMGELLTILKSNSGEEAFQNIPGTKPFIDLVNMMPELMETVLFTGMFHSEKIIMKLESVDSFEAFCANHPEEIFSQAPKSSFNAKHWTDTLCSINDTLLDTLMQYKAANQINDIIEQSMTKPMNFTNLVDKTEKLMNRFQQEIPLNMRVFDAQIWADALMNLGSLMENYLGTDEQIFSETKTVTIGVLQFLQTTPETREALHYLDAVLDIIGNRIDTSQVDLVKAFDGFPTVTTLLKLLDQAPEMIETVLYTVFTQPQKTAAWSSALQSWSTFCSTPSSDIMMAPPGSKFDVASFLAKMCTVDIEQLVRELNTYQGAERIKQITMANGTDASNITSTAEKMNKLFQSIEHLVTGPMDQGDLDLRLLNVTIWNGIGKRLERWLGESGSDYGTEMTIVDIINQVYWSTLAQIPEAQAAFSQMLAITSLIGDQTIDYLESGYINSTMGNSTAFQKLLRIANHIPEMVETVIYTAEKHPEKITGASNNYVYFETLCSSPPEDLYSVPPGVTFDLKGWFSDLCSLNMDDLGRQLAESKSAKDLESIMYGGAGSSSANITSVVGKIDRLMNLLDAGPRFNDRFLDESVWSSVITRAEQWINDPSGVSSDPLSYVSQIFGVLEELQMHPAMRQMLQPLAVTMQVVDGLMEDVLHLENKTTIQGKELFEGWQGMEQMLTFVETPGVLDVLLASGGDTEKLMSLFSEEGLRDFCDPASDPSKYLTPPTGSSVDLGKVKDAFCDVDFDRFMDGVDSFVNTKAVEGIVNGSLTFDWKSFGQKVNRFSDLLTKWERQPPTFNLPPQWMNESYWQNLLDSSLTSLPEKLSAKEQVLSIIQQLGPLLDTEGFKQVGTILNSVMDILNLNIRSLQGARLTLGSLMESVPALKNIFMAVGVNSQTLRSFAMSPIKNTDLFLQLFVSDDVQNDFCYTDKWDKAIEFPANFDTSGLVRIICANDWQAILTDIEDNFNLTQTLESLMNDDSSRAQDWTDATEKIFDLVDSFEILLNNPPTLNADETLSVLSETYNMTNLFKLTSAFSVLSQMFNNGNDASIGSGGSGMILETSEELNDVVRMTVGVLDRILARVKVQNGRLDIAAVFKEVPEVQRVINGILSMKPDPLSGLFAVVLRADRLSNIMTFSSDPSFIQQIFCDKRRFERTFEISPEIDVDKLLASLCNLDFDEVADKWGKSFGMSNGAGFDMESFSEKMENIVTHLTNLTTLEHVLFNGTDLARIFMVNNTRLMSMWEEDYFGNVPEEYVTLTAQILNSVLNEMNSTDDLQTLATSLTFIEAYLDTFNSFLRSIKDEPIRLSMLLNNTEVGDILTPILNNQNILDGLVDMTVDINKLSEIIEGPSPDSALCGDKLFEALKIPANEIAAFKNLQTRVCSTNETVLLWQTIALQANGYFLYKQLEHIETEVSLGRASINTTAVGVDLQDMISLMQTIIGQYVDGSRSFTDLVDADRFKAILEHTQKSIQEKLLAASKDWSVDMADIILPKVVDQQYLLGLTRVLNTANLFMNMTVAKLEGWNEGIIYRDDLFLKADGLQNVVEAYMRIGTNLAPALSNNEFDVDQIGRLFKDTNQVASLCQQPGGIVNHVTVGSPPSQTAQDLSTVVCYIMGSTMTDDVKKVIGYNEIGDRLTSIWESRLTKPDYTTLVQNVKTFTRLVQQLVSYVYTINPNMLNMFNLQNTMVSLQNIAQNPQIIFQLLKLLGVAVDSPIAQEHEAVKSLSQMNSFVLMPLVRVLEAMKAKGLTISSMADNPDSFLNLMSVLVDFDVHFDVIREFAVKPQIATMRQNWYTWCMSSYYRDMVEDRLAAMPSLPVTGNDVLSMVCNEDNPDKWIGQFEKMGLTNVQMEVVLDKMMERSDLFAMYDDSFGWTGLMSSLERLSALISAAGGTKATSKMADVHSAWDATKDILFQNGFKSLFSYLELIEIGEEPFMGSDWVVFKQFLRFFTSVMQTIDHSVQRATDEGQLVQLKDALPDPQRLADVVSRLIGRQNAAELLVTSLDPIQFYTLSLYNSWEDICDGTTNITTYFYFPDGANVKAITQSLCQAVASRTSAFDEMLSLFGAHDMFKQLDTLVQGQWNASGQVSVYEHTHSAMMHLIKTFEIAEQTMVADGSINDYVQPVLRVLETFGQSQQTFGVCSAVVDFLNSTREYDYYHSMFANVFTAVELASHLAKIVPEIDDLACSLKDEKEISVKNFMSKLDDIGVIDNIEEAVEGFMNPPSLLHCAAPVTLTQTLMTVINGTVWENALDIGRMDRCMKDTSVEFRRMVSSTSKLMDFIKQLVGAMQSPSLQKLLNDPEVLSTFSFIMHAIDVNGNMVVKFQDLLMNDGSATSYLTDILAVPRGVATALMNSTVDQDWNNLLTKSVNEIGAILCDPSRLSRVLTLPERSGVNVTEISHMICNNEITDTVEFLKNISASSDQISKQSGGGTTLMKIVVNLTDGLSNLITSFDGIVHLFVDLATKQDFDVLEGNVDVIDDIIQGNVMERFGESLKQIFNGVKPFFSRDATTQDVVKDVEKVIDGIIAINVLIKGPIRDTLEVQDLVVDLDSLKKYMLDVLKLSPEVTDTVLQSVFSTRVFLGLDDKLSYTCQDVLDMLLIMNGTNKTPADIAQPLCQLDDKELTGLVNALKMELDIGGMIAKYVSYTTNSVLASTNMSKAELSDMVIKIDKSQAVIQMATEEFKKTPNGSQILEIFSGANSDAFMSMDKLTPLMCGNELDDVFKPSFSSGLVISSSDKITQEIHKGFDHDVSDLPNQFCVDIYENIRNSAVGSIIWAYVKPIMRGKILYTPDNDVTRAIIKKANKTFESIEEVHRISHIWAKESPNLMGMTVPVDETEGLRDALENDFIKGLLESTVGVSATSVLTGLDALQSNNFDSNDLKSMQAVAEIIANYTSCIEMNRFVPVKDEDLMEMEAYKLNKNKTFWAGIVFTNAGVSDNVNFGANNSSRRKRQSNPDIPKHMEYKIRMDVDNVMDTAKIKSAMYKMAAEDSFVEDMRYLRGFIYIQDILDNSIIGFHKYPVLTTPGFKIRQMPFPCHHNDSFIFMLGSYLIPIMMTFVFLAAIGTATNNLIYDRENGQEQTLRIMGMLSGLNFLAWFVTTMVMMTIVSGVIAIMCKYTDIFIYSNPVIIFLFLVTFCFSSIMLLYMVSAFFNRTTMAILFVLMIYLTSYLPYILVVSLEIVMEPWQKILACIASTTAFSFGAHNMGYLEEGGVGVQWSNIDTEGAKDYSMQWACCMMLIDSAIYLVIGWYVRNIKPGKYGVPQPFYFPLSPSFWRGCFGIGQSENKYLAPNEPEGSKGSLFEDVPADHCVGIEVHNLSKSYGKKKVLHPLSINFYEGQISCLLGHNGAAKTTAMKLLCGVLDPSTGSVLLNGKKPNSGQLSLGVCPQQNALFDYMSVLEHMEFYSGVKGSEITINVMAEIKKLLKDVDLWHVRNVTTGDLSYGMKRRLCVALAFVGGSRTVVLDEPTSGVDPHARKNIWNLISSNRRGRTILMSTHHLDEADILSDRIAVLHKGRLLCCGSPTFLKRQIGGGYKLTISKFDNSVGNDKDNNGARPNVEDNNTTRSSRDFGILSYIQTMSPTAVIVESMGTEMVIEIPKDENLLSVPLPVFFQELDRNAKDIGIADYGLTDVKVEDIFLQLTYEMDRQDEIGTEGVVNPALAPEEGTSSVNLPEPQSTVTDQQQSVDTKLRITGGSLVWSQIVALLVKRFHHYRRNWRMLLTCILFPLLVFMIAIGFSTIRPDEEHQKPLVLDPVMYGKGSYTFLQQQNLPRSTKAAKLTKAFRNSTIGIGTSCMADIGQSFTKVKPSCSKGSAPYKTNKTLYVISCTTARQEYIKIDNLRTIVQQRDLPNDLYLQNMDNYTISSYLLRTFRDYKDNMFGGWSIEKPFEEDDPAEYDPYVWFNSKGYHAMPSFLSSLSNSVLRAYLPDYENPDEYGITTINHPIRLGRSPLTLETLENDAADAGISIMVVIAFSFIPCGFVLYIINERIQKEKQLQQISGVGTVMYWVVSWVWDTFVYLIGVGIAVAVVVIFRTDSFYIRDNLLAFAVLLIMYGWAMIPYMYLMSRFFRSASTAYLVMFCLNLFLAMATVISLLVMQLFRDDDVLRRCYEICRYAFLVFPQFALGQGCMDMVSATVKYKLFLRFGEDFYDDPFEYDITGYKLVAMAIFGFVFFILNLLAEKVHGSALSIPDNHSDTTSELDQDVAKEADRIRHSPNSDLLQVNNLSKVYRRGLKKFSAVDHINFGVQQGEAFGLLGVNGAGKTTTFRMLTGDLGSSGGSVVFNGRKISSHDRHFGQSVGYCPQEGGLDEYLTATETLHFHARLRGFEGKQSKELVAQLLERLGLKQYANKAVHTYSGGTKRKLALAVAMLGDPPILYLDEPTTGMDAATRRQAWRCIAQANLNGQSVVLTSHTMDECDALCARIAIMVNGQIKCIGSPQHLKSKFGDGYTATVHSQENNLGLVSHFFLNQFPGSLIRTSHHSSVEIMIPHTCGSLGDIMAVLQRAQQDGTIEYYSLSQTTLDSVFVSFAQEQTDSFDEGTVTNGSSIEDKSYTPRSSVSSERPPSYDGPASDKKAAGGSPYVFSNPQFVHDEVENEVDPSSGSQVRPRYVTNLTLAAEMAPVPKADDVEIGGKENTRM